MKIVAFDPGHTTGVALYKGEPGDIVKEDMLYETTEATGLEDLWAVLHMGAPYDRVIYESFLYQRRDKVDLRPVKAIGAIELFCNQTGISWREQTPATGKRFWTDKKIKKLGLWEPGKPHAMDALRHLLYYQAFELKQVHLLERLKE